MKLKNLNNEIILNSKNIINSYENSLYDIYIRNNRIYIPDYKNNKLIIYDLRNKKLLYKLFLSNPHSILFNKNKLIICTYRNQKIAFNNLQEQIVLKRNKFFSNPICLAKSPNNYLLINWNDKNNKKLIFFDKNFKFIKYIIVNKEYFFPHYVIYHHKKFFVVNHTEKDPMILIFDVNGNLLEEIVNISIKNPVSIKYFLNYFFICDYKMNSINVFNSKFKLMNIYNYNLNFPMNVAYYKNKLYVCEELSNRIFSLEVVK